MNFHCITHFLLGHRSKQWFIELVSLIETILEKVIEARTLNLICLKCIFMHYIIVTALITVMANIGESLLVCMNSPRPSQSVKNIIGASLHDQLD